MNISPLAGKLPPPELLIDASKLIQAYYKGVPDPSVPAQRVEFGTSGHRGSSLSASFNEHHILAITQAICLYRNQYHIDGPLFLGMDTHALSMPAFKTALEVLAANGVAVMVSEGDEYTPTPVISHAILVYNRGRKTGCADGIVVTPSHNPPDQGGFKYNSSNGGPADPSATDWIQERANELLERGLSGVKRIGSAGTVRKYDYRKAYIRDLGSVIDMETIRKSGIRIGVDPLGGAGLHYWEPIADLYGIDLTVVNQTIDPTFRFMSVDWDGKIRMDPSSSYAMAGLIGLKDRFDIAFACDTDHDRHGIVAKSCGLMPANHYLSAAILYLFQNRPHWSKRAAVGKTLVSSGMIDRVADKLGRKLYEVPVGFKWFVQGLLDGSLSFAGEESAGGSFSRMDGTVWTTDKDGIILALLSAEMRAALGRDPGELYQDLTAEFGTSAYALIEAPATAAQKKILKNLSPDKIRSKKLGGEEILSILTQAPGNNAPIGGLKVITANGWFAARPSGTESLYKIYGESFLGKEHLNQILKEAQTIVSETLLSAVPSDFP
ncbi:MAG: phosphoglucomutase (alpha-D-glucose-1,6-bisphosphate-dependent) [Chlamydiales bacterium]